MVRLWRLKLARAVQMGEVPKPNLQVWEASCSLRWLRGWPSRPAARPGGLAVGPARNGQQVASLCGSLQARRASLQAFLPERPRGLASRLSCRAQELSA